MFGFAKNRFIGIGKVRHAYACVIAYPIDYLNGCVDNIIRNVEEVAE